MGRPPIGLLLDEDGYPRAMENKERQKAFRNRTRERQKTQRIEYASISLERKNMEIEVKELERDNEMLQEENKRLLEENRQLRMRLTRRYGRK
jgi:hypothetical protein